MGADTAQNPCIATFGPGPAGERCGSCLRLKATRMPRIAESRVVEQTVYYCGLSFGARRVTAPACGRFEGAERAERV
jgi:hypothetical protein